MNPTGLFPQILQKKSYLCVGLDTETDKIPAHLKKSKNPVLDFNKTVIDATKDLCVAYKINIAFYESMGVRGWEILEETLAHIPEEHFTIADAKRGDIGNTARLYARTFFETYPFDAVTVSPYMGEDSVRPFLEFENKTVILLGLTSNPGSRDFQMLSYDGTALYETVIQKAQQWGHPGNLMFVVGATHPGLIASVRSIAPDSFFLVPGVGAQGGDLEKISQAGMNRQCGLLVNSSRAVIYAGQGEDYAVEIKNAAFLLQQEMAGVMKDIGILGY